MLYGNLFFLIFLPISFFACSSSIVRDNVKTNGYLENKSDAQSADLDSNVSNSLSLGKKINISEPRLLNVKTFGAKGDGITDDSLALQNAFNYSRSNGGKVYIPEGKYLHSKHLVINGSYIYGDGSSSLLLATNPDDSTIVLTGQNSSLDNVSLASTNAAFRKQGYLGTSVYVHQANEFLVSKVLINKSQGAGIMIRSSSNGKIEGNRVLNTYADAIHITAASHDVIVSKNFVDNAGDDCIAVVSYEKSDDWTTDIQISNNTVQNSKARGISVLGGMRILINNNLVKNFNSSGIYAVSEYGRWKTRRNENITIRSNTVENSGRVERGNHPSIFVGGLKDDSNNFLLEKNIVKNPVGRSFRTQGSVKNLRLQENTGF